MTVSSDPEREATYTAERRVARWAQTPGPVRVFGNTWDVEPNARFPGIVELHAYVDRVLALQPVVDTYPGRAALPVRVRARRGPVHAEYSVDTQTIAIPDPDRWGWASDELTVLHELAHHLTPAHEHDTAFRAALLLLLRVTGHSTMAFLTQLAFHDAGLASD